MLAEKKLWIPALKPKTNAQMAKSQVCKKYDYDRGARETALFKPNNYVFAGNSPIQSTPGNKPAANLKQPYNKLRIRTTEPFKLIKA